MCSSDLYVGATRAQVKYDKMETLRLTSPSVFVLLDILSHHVSSERLLLTMPLFSLWMKYL